MIQRINGLNDSRTNFFYVLTLLQMFSLSSLENKGKTNKIRSNETLTTDDSTVIK